MTFGNGTVYMDIPVPFTRWAIVLDVGRHNAIGYRIRDARTLGDASRARIFRP